METSVPTVRFTRANDGYVSEKIQNCERSKQVRFSNKAPGFRGDEREMPNHGRWLDADPMEYHPLSTGQAGTSLVSDAAPHGARRIIRGGTRQAGVSSSGPRKQK